jgi:hypothetical protein
MGSRNQNLLVSAHSRMCQNTHGDEGMTPPVTLQDILMIKKLEQY